VFDWQEWLLVLWGLVNGRTKVFPNRLTGGRDNPVSIGCLVLHTCWGTSGSSGNSARRELFVVLPFTLFFLEDSPTNN
jgi:hypothetical protein